MKLNSTFSLGAAALLAVSLLSPKSAMAFGCECTPIIVQNHIQTTAQIQGVNANVTQVGLGVQQLNNVTIPQAAQAINSKLADVGNAVVEAIRGHIKSDQQLFHDLEVKLDMSLRNHAATTTMSNSNRTYALGHETIGADGRTYRSGPIPSSTCAEISSRTTTRGAASNARAGKWYGAGSIARADSHNRAARSSPESMATASQSMAGIKPASEDPKENPLLMVITSDEAPKSVSSGTREKVTGMINSLTNPVPPASIDGSPNKNTEAAKEYKLRSDLFNLKMLLGQSVLMDTAARMYTAAAPSQSDKDNSARASQIWKEIDPTAKVRDENGVMSELAILQTKAVHRYYDVAWDDPKASWLTQLNNASDKGVLIEIAKMQAIELRLRAREVTLAQQSVALQAFNTIDQLNGIERPRLQELYSRALGRPNVAQ